VLRERYEALLEQYSEQHPDVVRALTQLRESELLLADAGARLDRSSPGIQSRDLERIATLEREMIVQFEEQQVRIRELQRSLDRTNAQLIEREHELEQLQATLEETTPSP